MFTILSLVGFFTTLIATAIVRKIALKKKIVDDPAGVKRKIHKKPIPLLGGVAVYIGLLTTLVIALLTGVLPAGSILSKHIWGLLLGGLFLVIGGVLDDKYNISPKKQIIWPILSVITVIVSGIGIESITNPLGGQIFFNQIDIPLFSFGGIPYKITLFADFFTFLWLMGVIYAIKFFDGLDGLVAGITIIGSFTVFFTSLLPKIAQTETALVAIIVAACFGGFLIWNFYPAKIFLGESGSTLAGFLMGTLAIIAESKVVTTLVVMALPILDLVWVIVRRTLLERKSPVHADRKHIHHRLLDTGFSHRSAVMILYLWAIILGFAAWFYQSTGQPWALVLALLAVIIFAFYLVKRAKKYEKKYE